MFWAAALWAASACAPSAPAGGRVETRSLGEDARAYGLARSPAGDLYQVGEIVKGRPIPGGPVDTSLWIGRWSPRLEWVRHRAEDGWLPGPDAAYGVAVDDRGFVYAVGFVAALSGGEALWIGKYDAALEPVGRYVGPVAPEGRRRYAQSVAVASDGSLFVGGWIGHRPPEANDAIGESVSHFGRGQLPWLGKFSPELHPQGEVDRPDVGSNPQRIHGLAPDPAGGVYAAGSVSDDPISSGGRWWVAHYDAGLRPLAEYRSPESGDFEARAVVRSPDGALWVVGSEGQRCFVARFSPDLRLATKRYLEPRPLPLTPIVRPRAAALGADGLWVSGFLTETDRNRDDEPQSAFLALVPMDDGPIRRIEHVRSEGAETFGWGAVSDSTGGAYVSGTRHGEGERREPFLLRAAPRP